MYCAAKIPTDPRNDVGGQTPDPEQDLRDAAQPRVRVVHETQQVQADWPIVMQHNTHLARLPTGVFITTEASFCLTALAKRIEAALLARKMVEGFRWAAVISGVSSPGQTLACQLDPAFSELHPKNKGLGGTRASFALASVVVVIVVAVGVAVVVVVVSNCSS